MSQEACVAGTALVDAVEEADDPLADVVDETEVPAKYLAIFLDETEMSLDQLTESLLAQEAVGSCRETENLLVIAHRIKGGAAAVGLHRPAKLAHAMEDILQRLRERELPLTSSLAELEPILRDLSVFADKIARHPGELGVQGVITRDGGLKEVPPKGEEGGRFRR